MPTSRRSTRKPAQSSRRGSNGANDPISLAEVREGRLRALEDENKRLRALVLDLSVEAWTRHSVF